MAFGSILDVPELTGLGARKASVRLPDLVSVPLTRRVIEVVDHPSFQRLRRVRQLGTTFLVYPGATHTRFEHSIGVYGTARLYLLSLLGDPQIRERIEPRDVRTLLMAALLHDLGHTPFAHTLEAAHGRFQELPRHEDLVEEIVFGRLASRGGQPSLAIVLERSMEVDPHRVVRLIRASRASLESKTDRFLQSIISSALDADKMDYLWRDSVHLGVPYGRNYDRERLLSSLTIDRDEESIAITAKGRISAEVFLFCRYTMYSEVYWHHAVRSASAMVGRAWDDIITRSMPDAEDLKSRLLAVGDDEFLASLAAEAPPQSTAARLLKGITHSQRRLYKRIATWSRPKDDDRQASIYRRLIGLDRANLRRLEGRLRARLSVYGRPLNDPDLIIDIPPSDKDTTPDVAVVETPPAGGGRRYAMLSQLSSIAQGISEDFLTGVKSIQLLAHPEHAPHLREGGQAILDAIEEVVLD